MSTPAARPPGTRPLDLIAVMIGGAIGTVARASADLAVANEPDHLALSTLAVNVTGSFVLGVLVAALWPRVPSWTRAGLGPGILGSFTTFSAVAVSIVSLTQFGNVAEAVLTIVLNIGLGMLAAGAGLLAGAQWGRRAGSEPKGALE